MRDIGPYSNYRLTVRLELANKPGIFARVAALLAEEQANLGAVDLVSATKTRMVRDITFDVQNEEHGEKVLARLDELPDVIVLSASDLDLLPDGDRLLPVAVAGRSIPHGGRQEHARPGKERDHLGCVRGERAREEDLPSAAAPLGPDVQRALLHGERGERAEALRANLRRRKEQTRARAAAQVDDAERDDEPR